MDDGPNLVQFPLQVSLFDGLDEGTSMARRRYQRGSVFLRGTAHRVWTGRWREDVIVHGIRHRKYRSEVLGTLKEIPTKKLALRALEKKLEVVNCPNYQPSVNARLKEVITRWETLILPQQKPSSQASAKSRIKQCILPQLGEVFMSDMNTLLLQKYISNQGHRSPKTLRNILGILRIIWNSARAWGYVQHNPFEGLLLPKRQVSHRFYFSEDDIKRILAAASGPYKTFYWLAAESGFRSGELCALRVEDITFTEDAAILRVRESVWGGKFQSPKSRAAVRAVCVSPQLADHLRTYLQAWKPNESRLLFASSVGTPWIANMVVRRKLHPLLKRLRIMVDATVDDKGRTVHKVKHGVGLKAFRHGNATMMDRLNAPIKTRQVRLGHMDPKTTIGDYFGGYTHMVSEDDRKIAGQLGALFVNASKSQEAGAEFLASD